VGTPRIIGLDESKVPEAAQLQIVVSEPTYQAIASLKDGTPVSFAATTRAVRLKTWNAIGALPGSHPQQAKQAILLSAHLDHLGADERGTGDPGGDRIYNGADDDASGTTAVLALAEALAQGTRPHRTVIFALFGSEEAGGFGAKWVVERPPVPLASIVANLEFEMIGRPDAKVAAKTLWLTGWERTDLGPELARHGAHLVADPHPDQNFFMRSDNITLARRGVIAQTISSYGMHGEYHQPSDDLQHIDFAHMTQAIQALLGSIRWLADSAFEPQWRPGGRPQ
jgi:Zn-dependent M28 family amino/carboxypeptidase